MDDRINDVVIEYVAVTESTLEPPAGVDRLGHVDAYDVPAAYSRRISNIESVDEDNVAGGQYMFADRVPEDFDAIQEDPNLYYVTYEDGRVQVQLTADEGGREDLLAALEHLLAEAALVAGHFRVVVEVALDAAAETDLEDADPPREGYRYGIQSHPTEDRSAVGFLMEEPGELVLRDSADPIRDRVAEARAFVEDHLP